MIRFRVVGPVVAAVMLTAAASSAVCTFSASPSTPVIAGNRPSGGTVTVTTGAGCTWSPSVTVPWITLDDGAGNPIDTVTGPGSFHYNILLNQGWAVRSSAINIAEVGQPPFAAIDILQRGYKNVYMYEGSLESFIARDSSSGAYYAQTLKTDGGCATCTSGLNNLWGQSAASPAPGTDPHPSYAIEATATFWGNTSNGGGLYRRNHSTGDNILDLPQMCGRIPCVASIQMPPLPNPDYQMAAAGDFDGDHQPDILWRNPVTGATAIWLLTTSFNPASVTLKGIVNLDNLPASFKLSGVYDFNNDGMDDILWRNNANGNDAVWIMNGSTISSIVNLEAIPSTAYYVGAVTDYDNDGQPDILWRNDTTTQLAVWKMNGATHVTTINLVNEGGISVIGPR